MCVPCPTICPSSITRIRSASSTEEIRCAIINFVVSFKVVEKLFRICASVAVSTALVLSSKIRIFGFLSSALAIQRRCFCPPETLTPPCPSSRSYPSANSLTKPSGLCCLCSLFHLFIRCLFIAPAKIFHNTAGKQRIFLKHHRNAVTQMIQRILFYIHAIY